MCLFFLFLVLHLILRNHNNNNNNDVGVLKTLQNFLLLCLEPRQRHRHPIYPPTSQPHERTLKKNHNFKLKFPIRRYKGLIQDREPLSAEKLLNVLVKHKKNFEAFSHILELQNGNLFVEMMKCLEVCVVFCVCGSILYCF